MRVLRPASPLLAVACLAALAACGGDGGQEQRTADTVVADTTPQPGGTLVLAVAGGPNTLLPPRAGSVPAKQVVDLVFERLAEIGRSLNTVGDADFTPKLARSWEWSADSLSIAFRLDSTARWHDGRPVTAEDVRFTVALSKDPATASLDGDDLAAVDSVTTPDRHTAVFWFARRYPEQFYDAAGRASILPAHLLRGVSPAELVRHPLASKPVGSGRFRFVRWEPGVLVELAADTAHHLGRPMLDRVIMRIAPDPLAASTQFFAGEADVFEAMRPENMTDVARAPELVAHIGPSTAYSFLAFNFLDRTDSTRPHPILAEPAMRRAMAMAVDRAAIVKGVMDSLGVVGLGPFPRTNSEADTTAPQIAYDPRAAGALLDSLGWRDGDGDGVRERGGRSLTLDVLVPVSSALRARSATALQQQLAAAGVKLELRQLEFNAFWDEMTQGRFDAVLGSWVQTDGSPSGLRSTWGTGGAQNFGRYANAQFDAAVDSGNAAFDRETRRAHFRRAYRQMAADVPAIWLYEPYNAIGAHARFQAPELRATNWWLDIPAWWVPSSQRIARDGAPPTTVARR